MSNSEVYYNVVQSKPAPKINTYKSIEDAKVYIKFLDGYWAAGHTAHIVEMSYPSDYQIESIDRDELVLTVFIDDTSVEYSININNEGYISQTSSVIICDEDLNVLEKKSVETPQWIFDIVSPAVYAEID